jgi:hypothetical protein
MKIIKKKFQNLNGKGNVKDGGSKVKSHLKDLEEGNYVKKDSSTNPLWSHNAAPKKMSTKRGAVGSPVSNEDIKKFSNTSRGSVADLELRHRGKSSADFLKASQKSQLVPNKALATKTEDFGPGYGKKTYSSGNPGGLKVQTKGGNASHAEKFKNKSGR